MLDTSRVVTNERVTGVTARRASCGGGSIGGTGLLSRSSQGSLGRLRAVPGTDGGRGFRLPAMPQKQPGVVSSRSHPSQRWGAFSVSQHAHAWGTG